MCVRWWWWGGRTDGKTLCCSTHTTCLTDVEDRKEIYHSLLPSLMWSQFKVDGLGWRLYVFLGGGGESELTSSERLRITASSWLTNSPTGSERCSGEGRKQRAGASRCWRFAGLRGRTCLTSTSCCTRTLDYASCTPDSIKTVCISAKIVNTKQDHPSLRCTIIC